MDSVPSKYVSTLKEAQLEHSTVAAKYRHPGGSVTIASIQNAQNVRRDQIMPGPRITVTRMMVSTFVTAVVFHLAISARKRRDPAQPSME